ncbi:MAG: helix-turn-helix domain-containing protein [Nitriliruptoraceae bacterium]
MDRRAIRDRLDNRLVNVSVPPRPHLGWVRAIREALNMSAAEMGERMGVNHQRVFAIEKAEQARAIQLDTLDRAAAALGCRVEYVLVPADGTSLADMVHRQAEGKARQELQSTDTTMQLEDQPVSEATRDNLLAGRIADLIDKRGLWRHD